MSMGYDDDDPRRQAVLDGLSAGLWRQEPRPRAARRALKGGPRSVTLPARPA